MTAKSTPRGSAGGRRRPPHNTKLAEYESFGDLLSKAANAPRTAEIHGREFEMSRAARLFHLSIDRAVQGNPREVVDVIRRMAKNPNLAASFRIQLVAYAHGELTKV